MDVILRFSINGDKNSKLRNRLKKVLTKGDFSAPVVGTNTATYKHQNIDAASLALVLSEFWTKVSEPDHGATIDHFWLYTDSNIFELASY